MTSKEVREKLKTSFSTVSLRNGIYTAKKSYHWGIAQSGDVYADIVRNLIPRAKVLDYGNHFHYFVGGAKPGSPKDSYFWVKFTLED